MREYSFQQIHVRRKDYSFFMESVVLQKNQEMFQDARTYLDYLYIGSNGKIFKCQKINSDFFTDCHTTKSILKQSFDGINDVYVSMNSFYMNSRKSEYLKRLNCFYVDIDCYNKGLTQKEVLKELEEKYFGKTFPYPTFVVNSGRGLYLIWKFSKSEDRNAKSRWVRIEKILCNLLSDFGSDPACSEPSRILRVVGSINSKSKTKVFVEKFYGQTYSLYNFEKFFKCKKEKKNNKPKSATERQRRYAVAISMKSGDEIPNFESKSDTYKWIKSHQNILPYTGCGRENQNIFSIGEKYFTKKILGKYLLDLQILFSLRKKENCKREVALFLCRLWHKEISNDSSFALEKTLAFNANLYYPLPEKYVKENTKSADGKTKYHYSKKRIIEILEITKEEMQHLHFLKLFSVEEKKNLKKTANRHNYLAKLVSGNKKTKEEDRSERRKKICELIKKGLTNIEIQHALNISKATFYREYRLLDSSLGHDFVVKKDRKDVNTSIAKKKEYFNGSSEGDFRVTKLFKKLISKVSFFQPIYWERTLVPYPYFYLFIYFYTMLYILSSLLVSGRLLGFAKKRFYKDFFDDSGG